jgi:hypothetical protein
MPGYRSADVLRTTSNMEKPGVSVRTENTSQKMFIGNDTISEIVNDSESVVILVNFLTATCAK